MSAPPPSLQRSLTRAYEKDLLSTHVSSLSSSPASLRAFVSASHPSSRFWLNSLPSSDILRLSSREFSLASRLRLFLPPSDSISRSCRCSPSADLSSDPAHFLSCRLLKDLRRVRHDRIVRLLASLINRSGGVSQVEPSHFPSGRPDILVFLHTESFIVDAIISHPSSPSYLSHPPTPLTIASLHEQRKINHYASTPTSISSRLVPFALESFGAIGRKGLHPHPQNFLCCSRLYFSISTFPSHCLCSSNSPPKTQRLHPFSWHCPCLLFFLPSILSLTLFGVFLYVIPLVEPRLYAAVCCFCL